MSFISKTYTLEKDENFKEFLQSFGLPEEQIQVVLDFKPEYTVKKEGDQYVLNMTTLEGGNKDLKFTDGVEFDEEVSPGKFAKTKFTLDGSVLSQTQNFDDGLCVTYRREFSDDKLVVVITSSKWNGTARRYFTAA